MSEVTQLLTGIERGEASAAALLPLVYDELRRLAAVRLAQERPGQTLQATALVHEAWLRLAGSESQHWEGRRHFFAVAAEAMRRILVENARRKRRRKHGGGMQRVDVADLELASPLPDDELLALDEALTRLAATDLGHSRLNRSQSTFPSATAPIWFRPVFRPHGTPPTVPKNV